MNENEIGGDVERCDENVEGEESREDYNKMRRLRQDKVKVSDFSGCEERVCACCGHTYRFYSSGVLCWYCYYRATVGTTKLLIFQVMRDTGNEFRTPEEIRDAIEETRGVKLSRKSVYNVLKRYTWQYRKLDVKKHKKRDVLMRKVKHGAKKRGRPYHEYALSQRLLKKIAKYEKRWKMGMTVNIKVSKGKNFRMTSEFKKRSRSIHNRIKMGTIEEWSFLRYDVRK